MTPAERARQIEKEEFAAECAAIRQRAYDLIAAQRPQKHKPTMRGLENLYEALGVTRTLKEWAEVSGIAAPTLYTRINTYNWTVERAVTEPIGQFGRRGKEYTVDGVSRSISQWAKLAGVSSSVVHTRIASGWPIEAAVTLPKGSSRPTSEGPGVPSDFETPRETGGRGTAQESPNITFSGNEA